MCIKINYLSAQGSLFPAIQGAAPSGVTVSRGSDVMPRVPRKSSVVTSATEELKFERAEELDEGEMKEVIIYLPPSQDDFDSEVARSEKYPIYVPNVALDLCGAGTTYTLKDLPPDVAVEMRPTFHGSKSPLYAYSIREFSYRADKRFLLRAPRETEPSAGSFEFADGYVPKSFYPWEGKFPSANLFSVSAHSEQDKQLMAESAYEMISVKSCLNEVGNPNINPTLNKTCLKFKPSTDDNIKIKNSQVENNHQPKNKSSEFCQHSEKSARFRDLFNKKTTFGGLLLFSITLLGYYNFVWIQ